MSKLLSKFIRVAVAGDTIDGREISQQQIQEMAETYDPKNRYGARIWPEHFRGLIPGGPFDALGDVTALKTETVKDGELKGKLALFAQIQPLPELIKMNKAGQKVYSSIEMMSNFAKSGKAYFTGLACTDSPASQGTEMMAFSMGEGTDVIAGPSNEFSFELEELEKPEEDKPSLLSQVKNFLNGKDKKDNDHFNDLDNSVIAVASSQQTLLSTVAGLTEKLNSSIENSTKLSEDLEKVQSEFSELKTKLESTPGGQFTERPPAGGGDNTSMNTDC